MCLLDATDESNTEQNSHERNEAETVGSTRAYTQLVYDNCYCQHAIISDNMQRLQLMLPSARYLTGYHPVSTGTKHLGETQGAAQNA